MLTKDTLQFLNRGMTRSLSPTRTPVPATGQLPSFKIQIPRDKLDLLVGMTLEDRYYVLSLLGKGGMSLVYKAKDLKTGEVVAVKCLRTQVLGDEMVVKRFKREADVLNRLNHPRIVQFFGYGTNSKGQPYFVMDYLIGTSLGEILRTQGRLELGRFQDIFVQVAAAIGHAHKHDAVHRDIKPGNIMLVERGGTQDYVKIVDFGIAKVTEGTQRLTRLGEVWGSPIYMSPEQCMGATTIDARTDIYSLGIVMYEALTGEVPFLGRNYADTMMKQISEEPPKFKVANPNVEIPEALEQIVFRAIKKRPEDRYQTMMDLKRDLERALNDSVGILPKQPGLLSISGKQTPEEGPLLDEKEIDSRRITSDRLGRPGSKFEKIASEAQQKITSEDIPRFNQQDRLNTPSKSPPPGPRTDPEPVGDMDFNPPADRLKFELTGPQVISASTDSAQKPPVRSPRVSRQNLPRGRSSRVSGEIPKIKEAESSGNRSETPARRRARTSRNRITANSLPRPIYDTASGSKEGSGFGTVKQIFIGVVIVLVAMAAAYLNHDYLDSFIKEVFTFESEEHSKVTDGKNTKQPETNNGSQTEDANQPDL